MPVRIRDRGAKALLKRLSQRARSLKVGVVGPGAQAPHAGSSDTVAMIAARHELGLGVPRRSFVRDTVNMERREIEAELRAIARKVFKSGLTIEKGLSLLGVSIVRRIRRRIRSGLTPPLAASTVKQKGSNVPLIESGQLVNSITWTLEEGR